MARYEKGRRCLVLKSPLKQEVVGTVVVLGELGHNVLDIHGVPVDERAWLLDPPIRSPRNATRQLAFIEPWLLPIDDPNDDIQKELQNELPETQSKELVQET